MRDRKSLRPGDTSFTPGEEPSVATLQKWVYRLIDRRTGHMGWVYMGHYEAAAVGMNLRRADGGSCRGMKGEAIAWIVCAVEQWDDCPVAQWVCLWCEAPSDVDGKYERVDAVPDRDGLEVSVQLWARSAHRPAVGYSADHLGTPTMEADDTL